jgi:hypothetical protein
MSTFYATFRSLDKAKEAVHELLNGGVDPDDLSLVCCHRQAAQEGALGEMHELPSTVGDATAFVGRADDPAQDLPLPRPSTAELTSLEMSRLSPVDTSDSDTDVDSIDQMEDSQEEYEAEIQPRAGISYSTHEKDDLALAVLTGFPTGVPVQDELSLGELAQEEQFDDSLEVIEIDGFVTIAGGGLLATAALDFAKSEGCCCAKGLARELQDDGVPAEVAGDLQEAFHRGDAVLAVAITPGVLNEDAVEEIAERHGGLNVGLFDAPRY